MLEAHAEVESVSLMLQLHHRRLDELFDRVEIATEIGSWSEARREFGQFRTALEEHFRIEEEFMFPSFEAFTRALGGPTAAMRAEHREIGRVLDVIERLLRDEQPIGEIVAAFEALLDTHNAKEEQGLYPLFERHAPPEAYSALDLELRPLSGADRPEARAADRRQRGGLLAEVPKPLGDPASSDRARRDQDPALWLDRFHYSW